MAIVNLPPFYEMSFTEEGANPSGDATLFFDEAFQTLNDVIALLNNYITDDWIAAPQKTTAEITALEPSAPLGAIWFNTSLAKLQVKTASGTVETITST